MYKGKMVDVTGIIANNIRVTFGKTAVDLSSGSGSFIDSVSCYFDDKN